MPEISVRVSSSPATLGTLLTAAHSYSFQEVLNDTGIGTLTMQNDDPQLSTIDFGDYLQWFVDGVQRFCTIVESMDPIEVSGSEESGQATKITGRGLVAEWERATVRPEYGFDRQPYGSARTFGFASPYFDDTGWGSTYNQFRQDNFDGPPVALLGLPEDAPDPYTYWIWSRTKPAGESPVGTCYFRKTFTIDNPGTYRLCCAGDNQFILYVDGLRILQYLGPSPVDGWNQLYETNIELSAGTHVIAAEVTNIESGSNTAGLYVYLTGFDLLGLIDPPEVVSDTTWKALDYPADVPGFTYGKVIDILLDEAQADGLLAGWTLGFTATTDTDGTSWPTVPDITVQVGADLLTVLKQFAESGIDFAADADAKRLDAWLLEGKGTTTGVTFTDGINVTERSRQRKTPACNRAQVEYARGVTEVASTETRGGFTSEQTYGPIRKRLDLTDFESLSSVEDYLDKWFSIWAWPQERVTVGIEPDGTPEADRKVPYEDFVVGDKITVGDAVGEGFLETDGGDLLVTDGGDFLVWRGGDGPFDTLRVASIMGEPDEVGLVRWTIDVASEGMIDEARLDRMLKAKLAGTVGGRTLAASPTRSGVVGNDIRNRKRSQLPSLSSYGSSIPVGSAGEVVAEAPYRITGLVATSSGDGTGSTTIRVTNVTTTDFIEVTIDDVEILKRQTAILEVASGHTVKMECTVSGAHSKVDVTIRAYHV